MISKKDDVETILRRFPVTFNWNKWLWWIVFYIKRTNQMELSTSSNLLDAEAIAAAWYLLSDASSSSYPFSPSFTNWCRSIFVLFSRNLKWCRHLLCPYLPYLMLNLLLFVMINMPVLYYSTTVHHYRIFPALPSMVYNNKATQTEA